MTEQPDGLTCCIYAEILEECDAYITFVMEGGLD